MRSRHHLAVQEGTCEGIDGRTLQDLRQPRAGLLLTQAPMTTDRLKAAEHALVVFQSDERQVHVACTDS